MTTQSQSKLIPIWSPQPGAQLNAIMATWCPELLYGGARGGGKTDFLLGDYYQDVPEYADKWRGIVFRRTLPELDDIISRSIELFAQTGADYSKTKKLWTFKNGATLRFRHLERDEDAQKYQGHAYCVAANTRILMGDGESKRIHEIVCGDSVATLSGARVVTDTIPAYLALCVKITTPTGSEIVPVWHPVLTSQGWQSFASLVGIDSREIAERYQAGDKLPCVSAELRLLRQHQGPASRAVSEATPNQCRGGLSCCLLSRLRGLVCRLPWQWLRLGLRRVGVVGRLLPGSVLGQPLACGVSCGLSGFQIALSSQCDCRPLSRLRGVFFRCLTRTGLGVPPLRVDAATPYREHCKQDAKDNTPAHSRICAPEYEHPYSGQVLTASEDSFYETCSFSLHGYEMVADITVEEVNHYICADTSIVNKNTWIGFDEVGNFPSADPVYKIFATLRSAHDVQRKRIRLTANPGGPGHSWVKARYVDPAPQGLTPILDQDSGIERLFVPSRVTDNMILMKQDPGYVARLQQVGSPELVRAWLDGDWNAVQGAYFTEFGMRHVVAPFTIPSTWLRFGCFDWGSASPYCYLWIAVSDGRFLPKHSLVVYREDYGAGADGKGRKWTAEQVAENILHMQRRDETVYSVGDPSMFKEDGGPSIGERMAKVGLRMRPADNKRIAGWDAIRQRLRGAPDDYDGHKIKPLLYMFNTCKNLIRTLPNLQHDSRHPEDLDTTAEDHAADALRYGVMSRPYTIDTHHAEPIKGMESLTLDSLIAKETKKFGKYRSNRL